MFRSSCRFVHSSITTSKIEEQSLTAVSNVFIPSLIASLHCSQTSSGVIGCNFNYSSTIFIWKSKVILPTSSFDARTATTNFLTLAETSASSGMFSSSTNLQAYSIVVSRLCRCVLNSFFSFSASVFFANNCLLLTLNSLTTVRACCSLILSYSDTP